MPRLESSVDSVRYGVAYSVNWFGTPLLNRYISPTPPGESSDTSRVPQLSPNPILKAWAPVTYDTEARALTGPVRLSMNGWVFPELLVISPRYTSPLDCSTTGIRLANTSLGSGLTTMKRSPRREKLASISIRLVTGEVHVTVDMLRPGKW